MNSTIIHSHGRFYPPFLLPINITSCVFSDDASWKVSAGTRHKTLPVFSPHQPAFLDPCSQTKSSRSRPLGNRPVWKPGHLQAFIWNYNQLCLEWFLLKLRSLNILRLSLCFNMVSAEIPLVFECILFCEIWFTVCPIKFQFHWLREELWLMHVCNSENSIIQQTALVKRSDRSPRHLERTQISMTSYSFV